MRVSPCDSNYSQALSCSISMLYLVPTPRWYHVAKLARPPFGIFCHNIQVPIDSNAQP